MRTDRERSLPPSIRVRQADGGTRLGRSGDAPHPREGEDLDEQWEPEAARGAAAPATPAIGTAPEGRPALPAPDDPARSADPAVCPFFRLDAGGLLIAPRLAPDEDHRCLAIGPARAQSLRQQELVCLRAAHVDCPRFHRGALVTNAPTPARPRVEMPRATLAALLVLVLSAGISFGYVIRRGGIDLPVAGAAPSSSALAVVPSQVPGASVVSPSAPPTIGPSGAPSPSEGASPSTAASPTARPTPRPTPKATPRPTPKPTPTAGSIPSASRLALLTPCPNQSGCYVYTVRSGDALWSIANWFGVPLATVKQWNPQAATAGIHAGVKLRIPTPTR
jgi:hypothetical protein